jgi:transcriptional regulator with XRE-family HTH domain
MRVSEIRPLLKARGFSQADLARALGMSRVHVTQMLSGKRRMSVDIMEAVEAFLTEAARKAQPHGVAKNAHAPFEHKAPFKRFITLEEARALKANPPPKLPAEERERLIREIGEMSEAYKLLPRANTMTDDEILGYDEFGIPSR